MTASLIKLETPSTLPAIRKQAKDYAGKGNKNTRRTYKAAWRDFRYYCEDQKVIPAPAAPIVVADYISCCAGGGLKVSTIAVRLAAISKFHKTNKLDDPTQDEIVASTLKEIKREHGMRPHEAAPILKKDLLKIAEWEVKTAARIRDKAILLVGWFGAFRRIELVKIKIEDVEFNDRGMAIVVPFSKTDQEGVGKKKHLPNLKNKSICPVTAMREWINVSGVTSGYVFRKIDRWGKIGKGKPGREGIFPHVVTTLVKDFVRSIGLDATKYSAHSLRAGFITQASLDGFDAIAIKNVSLHESLQTIAKYERSAGAKALEIITTMFDGENVAKL